MAAQSLRSLCEGLIDYAGLFPPAQLDMQRAVENYARYAMGEHRWMLGRFICPASRLAELTDRARALMPGTWATSGYREYADNLEPWRISAIVDMPLPDAIEAMLAFNRAHASEDQGLAGVDALEMKAPAPGQIDDTLDAIPDGIFAWLEIPAAGDFRGVVAAIAGSEAGAKIRCGGVTPDAIPPAERIASFVAACSAAKVPFKATAGLHHPVRAEQPLTYEQRPPRAVMHGFVNVFVGAALLEAGEVDEAGLTEILQDTSVDSFLFDEDAAHWRNRSVSAGTLAEIRRAFATGYGSCSFEEPVADMQRLGWL
ncbi:MAG: hypothetical protein ACF8R7_05505 [Phycisphaerales bacterium JB039]